MLWDVHMHTMFSGDSEADPEDMIRAGIKEGLCGLCFTDHEDLDYPDDDVFEIDFNTYFPHMKRLKEKYKDKIEVLCGMELGLQTHLADIHKELLDKYDFDFVIGSSHLVHGVDPYYPEYYKDRSEKEAYLEYFESIYENIKAYDGFDVYGHLDYVVRYGPNKDKDYTYEGYKDIIDEILKLLISKDKGIEVNTAGLRKGLKCTNPCTDIIKRYLELGGQIITLGADAHRPSDVAYKFNETAELLKSLGINKLCVFKNRIPNFFAIS